MQRFLAFASIPARSHNQTEKKSLLLESYEHRENWRPPNSPPPPTPNIKTREAISRAQGKLSFVYDDPIGGAPTDYGVGEPRIRPHRKYPRQMARKTAHVTCMQINRKKKKSKPKLSKPYWWWPSKRESTRFWARVWSPWKSDKKREGGKNECSNRTWSWQRQRGQHAKCCVIW